MIDPDPTARQGPLSSFPSQTGEATPRIALLASYPKSGSTWTRLFLSALAGVLMGKEDLDLNRRPFLVPFASDRGIISLWSSADTTDMTKDEAAHAQRSALLEMAQPGPPEPSAPYGRIVGLKTHDRWLVTENGTMVFPPEALATVIHLVRNPLDIVASMAHHLGCSLDQSITNLCDPDFHMIPDPEDGIIAQIPYVQGHWSSHTQSWLDAPLGLARKTLRYEDMLEDPIGCFRIIATGFGLEATEAQLTEAVHRTQFDQLQSKENSTGFLERPKQLGQFFRKGRSGGWQTELSPTQVDRMLAVHAPVMRRLNYLP